MILTLTGFMGCGKSSVGKALSSLLPVFALVDTDQYIEDKTGLSVKEIFAAQGEMAFRNMEVESLRQLLSEYREKDAIVSLGGGTLTSEECFRMVKDNTFCVYLRAKLESLVSILQNDNGKRPMLSGGDIRSRVESLMSERSSVYEAAASVIVDIDYRSYEDIAEEILRFVQADGKAHVI